MKLCMSVQQHLLKSCGVAACLLLTACDSPQQNIDQTVSDATANTAEFKVEKQEGKRLTEVAGRTALPQAQLAESENISPVVSKVSEPYIGRYHVVVDCHEKFALCEKGNAEFVINLLKDGTSHRTLIYMGKMSYEKKSNQTERVYQQNTWRFNPETHQIEVQRAEGVDFYYDVNADGDLVIDLEKIYANNQIENDQFIDGTYVPTQAYVLKKFTIKE